MYDLTLQIIYGQQVIPTFVVVSQIFYSLSCKYFLNRNSPLSLCPFVVWRCGPYPLRRQLMAAYPQALVALSPKPFLPCALSTTRNYLYALAIHPCPVSLMSFVVDIPR